jgi:hypothetical protein
VAEDLETIRRQVAIAGRVTDESSKQPIPRARVRLTNGPPAFVGPMVARAKLIPPRQAPDDVTQAYGDLDSTGVNNAGKLRAAQIVLDYHLRTGGAAFAVDRPDQTRTAADGHFHFLDLPDGNYAVTASLPEAGSRYGTTEVKNSPVSRNGDGRIAWAWTDMMVPPTTIGGKVTSQSAAPVKLASIRVKGSGESTLSDDVGEYRLSALEVGTRTLSVSAPGLKAGSEIVQLDEAGKKQMVDIVMTPANS